MTTMDRINSMDMAQQNKFFTRELQHINQIQEQIVGEYLYEKG